MQRVCLLAVIICSLINTAFSISCYQCQSTDHHNPYQCPEFFTVGDPDGHKPEPRECSVVHDAQFCIKQTGRFEGGLGTKRFCSSLDLGNYCNYVKQPGDDLEYRSCVYTCSSDGCNPAVRATPGVAAVVLLLATAALWR